MIGKDFGEKEQKGTCMFIVCEYLYETDQIELI
jgi:hypothetical protein